MISELRPGCAFTGEATRSDWRTVARQTGNVVTWRDGERRRVALEFWIGGKRRRIYSDVSRWQERVELTEESAHELLAEIRAQIVSKRSIEEALAPFLGSHAHENLFSTRWARFLEQKALEAKDGRITARHLHELQGTEKRGYLVPLLERSIYELDYGLLEDWLGWLSVAKPELSPKTRRHALTSVMTFAHWLHRRREIREVPEAPEIKVPEHAPVLLDDATRDAILGAIPEAKRGVFLAMMTMGLRPGEARALGTRDYDGEWITVKAAAKDGSANGEVGPTKTRQVRRLPCSPELAAWIEAHVSKADRLTGAPMFLNPKGRGARWGRSSMVRTWRAACRAALGREVPMYEATRHSFATLALARGSDLHSVQRFLGHTNTSTTQKYAKLAEGALVSVLRPQHERQR